MSGVPVVEPRNIRLNRIDDETVNRVEPEFARTLERYRLKPGDIVCTRTGDVGRYGLVGEGQTGWLLGSGCLLLRPASSVSPRYLVYYLSHPVIRDWSSRNAGGSAVLSLNAPTVRATPVVLPPRTVQDEIADILAVLDEAIVAHDRLGRTTTAIRDTLLPLLVTGPADGDQL